MLASTTPIVRVSYGANARHYFAEFVRTFYQVRDIGVDKMFIERVAVVEAWHETLEVADASGGKMHLSGCRRCKTANVLTLPYERVVFRGSVMGGRHGTLRWQLPMCTQCDKTQPSQELVAPILVYHGKRKDGFVDLPERLKKFLRIGFDPDTTS